VANAGNRIQRADLGARGVYYRIQIGPFASQGEAGQFCAQLKARSVDCFLAPPEPATASVRPPEEAPRKAVAPAPPPKPAAKPAEPKPMAKPAEVKPVAARRAQDCRCRQRSRSPAEAARWPRSPRSGVGAEEAGASPRLLLS
jgi:hypothetical protein